MFNYKQNRYATRCVPKELINTWLDQNVIEPFCVRNNEINFKTKDVWNALKTHNWYYSN